VTSRAITATDPGEQLAFFDRLEYRQPPPELDWRCLDCGLDTIESGDYYMLRDAVWLEGNPAEAGMLCLECVEKRLGRLLTPWDFSTAPINLRPSMQARIRRGPPPR
jgi:hypothetical protein